MLDSVSTDGLFDLLIRFPVSIDNILIAYDLILKEKKKRKNKKKRKKEREL